MKILNRSVYCFTPLEATQLPILKEKWLRYIYAVNLKGTILLSREGINLALAGYEKVVTDFFEYVSQSIPALKDSYCNDTYSNTQPFQYFAIKIKKHIIAYPQETHTQLEGAPYVSPLTLKDWLDRQADIVLLDTRNQYEVKAGSFTNAIHLGLKNFRSFPTQIQQLPSHLKDKTIVTFCTGGVRCEKASASLLKAGFKKVYQLQGGILHYFKTCQSQHYRGSCFVFDEREKVKTT